LAPAGEAAILATDGINGLHDGWETVDKLVKSGFLLVPEVRDGASGGGGVGTSAGNYAENSIGLQESAILPKPVSNNLSNTTN
jgi:hypothetical protein